MEHTQWAKDADLPAIAAERREAIAEEIADVAILLTGPCPGLRAGVAHDLDPAKAGQVVDMEEAVRRKLRPRVKPGGRQVPASLVEKARGVATKYDRL
jgi:hypothetical protein